MSVAWPKRYVACGKKFSTGGMSETFLYRDQHLDRPVIIKALNGIADVRRIMDELAALQSIRSKHVVQIYDVIRDDSGDVVAIVEEFLPGDDLTAVTPPGSEVEFLRVAYQIAEGIADIHDHGMIHRDIKRQNMKFDGERCLKIFDFGLTRDSGPDATTVGAVGTPGYMAPELFESTTGGTVSFTPAVDTFAFGATLIAFATGRIPRDLRQTPPRLPTTQADFRRLPFRLSEEVSNALNSCLDPDPAKRPRMSMVAKLIGLHLLRDRHRALLVSGKQTYVLDKDQRSVRLSVAGQGTLTITYEGLRFVISNVSGNVAINNMPLSDGDILPDSCVIVLGPPDLGTRRTMVTVDVSHPEVTI
jgi:serine/threonine protein kinase